MGSTSSPFLANATIRYHLNHIIKNSKDAYEVMTAKLIRDNIYIDDLILCLEDAETAIKVRKVATKIFGMASMSLTNWISLDVNVLESIPQELKAPVEEIFLNDIEDTANSISKSTKVIGMSYSPKMDNFNFSQY